MTHRYITPKVAQHLRRIAKRAEPFNPSDAATLRAGAARIDQLEALRDAVLDRHRDGGESQGYTEDGYRMIPNCCTECGSFGEYGIPYPCATVQAIEGKH